MRFGFVLVSVLRLCFDRIFVSFFVVLLVLCWIVENCLSDFVWILVVLFYLFMVSFRVFVLVFFVVLFCLRVVIWVLSLVLFLIRLL